MLALLQCDAVCASAMALLNSQLVIYSGTSSTKHTHACLAYLLAHLLWLWLIKPQPHSYYLQTTSS